MDRIIAGVYFGYLGLCVALGVAGELFDKPALCQFAVKLAMVFLSLLGVSCVVLVLVAFSFMVVLAARCIPIYTGRIRRWYEATKD
jgi:hypothetical protein